MTQTVLLVVSTLRHCGPINGVLNIARYLDPARYRAVIATLSPEPADSLKNDFLSLGVPVKQLQLSRIESLLYGTRELRRLVTEVKPSLVHSHGIRANTLTASARLGCPIVSTVHSDLAQDYRFAYGRCLGALAARHEYAALRRFNGLNAVSEPLAKLVTALEIPAHGILNGIELSRYYPAADQNHIQTLRRALGWSAEAVVVLHTGVLRNLKNPVEVINGFLASNLSRQGYLVIAGDGPQRYECQRAAGTASNITFLGQRRDVPELLRAADILISASSSEGLGTALLEGCVCGIRVLATDIPAHRHIQELFPDQVQIFDLGRSESVRNALDAHPQERWRQRFLPSAEAMERVSARTMSRNYQAFYSEVLQRTGHGATEPARVAS